MTTATSAELTHKHCVPCEGGILAVEAEQLWQYLAVLPHWKLANASAASGASRIS
jgi:hypothetical protein